MSVPVQEQVLDTAARIASSRPDWRFELAEIVRDLRHLNERTVRTHVVSRCCVNAPKNHLHKWPYFRRVSRGTYRVEPKYRQATSTKKLTKHTSEQLQMPRRSTIHAVVDRSGAWFVGECLELAVVT